MKCCHFAVEVTAKFAWNPHFYWWVFANSASEEQIPRF